MLVIPPRLQRFTNTSLKEDTGIAVIFSSEKPLYKADRPLPKSKPLNTTPNKIPMIAEIPNV